MLKGDGQRGERRGVGGSPCLQTSTSLLSRTASAPAHALGNLQLQPLDFKDKAQNDNINHRSCHLVSIYPFVNAYYILSRQTSLQ